MSDLLTFKQASKLLPGHPHVSTIHRWRLIGVRGVKLQTIMVGGRRLVSRNSLDHFIEGVTAVSNGDPVPVRSSKQRERDVAVAEKRLSELGI